MIGSSRRVSSLVAKASLLATGIAALVCVALSRSRAQAGDENATESAGAATYLVRPPAGTPGPPPPVRRAKKLAGPVPTNRFWSSLVAGDAPLPHYPHPLAVHACKRGLRVAAPPITVDARGLSAVLGETGEGEDLALTSSTVPEVSEIALESWGDWTLDVSLASATSRFTVTYGHGSPYVFARFETGGARLTFPDAVSLWSGDARTPVLGVTVRGRPYGLFGPTGSTWKGLETRTFVNEPGAARYFSLALLPAATPEALALFARHAHAHVKGSRASWRYDPKAGVVATTFTVETEAEEGEERDTLLALYPHQWAHTSAALLPGVEYETVRGKMKVLRGRSFATELRAPGLLPALPPVFAIDAERRKRLVADEAARSRSPPLDAYFEGKLLGRLADELPIVEPVDEEGAQRLVAGIEKRLERRFTAADADGKPKPDRFDYDRTWGTLIGRPAVYGNDTELNDHHLQYGYYLRAAAAIARRDPDWMKEERWGAFVRLLVRDVASGDREDARFPYLRCFDVYAGHSWASGLARYPAGNDLESSSEAMNAWSALVLLGQATGDVALRDRGMFLYATELSAIEEYWFDVARRNFPATLEVPALSMIWGGKARLETWFSKEPEALFAINWLPFHGGSLYLGRYPDSAERVYRALKEIRKSDSWGYWPDLVIMYRALSDPEDARRQLADLGPDAFPEAGSSRLNLEHWVGALGVLGQVDRTTTADTPLHAVFRRGEKKTYVAYRMPRDPAFVATFSDGVKVRCEKPGFSFETR